MPIVSASSAPAPTIWKVAIFSAGTITSNGEYIWDGVALINGKPQYQYLSGVNSIYFAGGEWFIEDTIFEENTYKSTDLITWQQENGALPVPSSALSYSQTSFINSIYFGFDAQDDFLDNILSRSSGGTSEFSSGPNVVVSWNTENEVWEAIAYGTRFYFSFDLFTWYNDDGTPAVVSLIAGMTYSE